VYGKEVRGSYMSKKKSVFELECLCEDVEDRRSCVCSVKEMLDEYIINQYFLLPVREVSIKKLVV